MGRPWTKSKRPSAGTTGSRRDPAQPVLFIDRNSGGHSFRGLLLEAGLQVVLHDGHFHRTTADEVWLREAGRNHWLIVTGDNAVTRSPLFLLELEEAKAFVFVLLGLNGATSEGKAACILKAYPEMVRLSRHVAPPALWRVGRDGAFRRFNLERVLVRWRLSARR